MKKIVILIMAVAAIFAFYTQGNGPVQTVAMAIAFAVFMMGMMWLSGKTPSKHKDDDQDGIS